MSCPLCLLEFANQKQLGAHLEACIASHERTQSANVERAAKPQRCDERVLCFVCGRRLNSIAQLPAHVAKCEAWVAAALKGGELQPERPRVPMPRAGDADAIRAWNCEALAIFQQALPQCSTCGRRFAAKDTRDKHAARCARRVSATPRKRRRAKSDSPDDPAVAAALSRASQGMAVCHVCGVGVCVSSLAIHVKGCFNRWAATCPRTDGDRELIDRVPPPLAHVDQHGEEEAAAAARAALRAYNRLAAEVHVELTRRGAHARCASCRYQFDDPRACAEHEERCGLEDEERAMTEREPIWRDDVCGMKNLDVQHAGAVSKSTVCDGVTNSEPMGAVCYLCGRICLINSLHRHVAKCATRWDETEGSKRVSEPMRRRPKPPRAPVPPPEHTYYASCRPPNEVSEETTAATARASDAATRSDEPSKDVAAQAADAAAAALLAAYNAEARQIFRKSSQLRCEYCDRFFADLKAHNAHVTKCRAMGKRQSSTEEVAQEGAALCPVCGRHALLGSLLLHLDQCTERWERREALKPPERRRLAPTWPDLPLPRAPGDALKQWNDAVRLESATRACPGCPRKFAQTRALHQHVARCCPEYLETLSEGSNESDRDDDPSDKKLSLLNATVHDPTVICFICGRRYGCTSIAKHTIACERRWERENCALPPAARRTLTYPEAMYWPPPINDPTRLAQYNALAESMYHQTAMSSCPRCARTFGDANARAKHMSHCCPDEIREIQEELTSECLQDDDPSVPREGGCVCYVCGQSVRTVCSFTWHLKKCRLRWMAAAALEPKHRRPKRPRRPPGILLPTPETTKGSELATWNNAARDAFLATCPSCPGDRCGRIFSDLAKLRKHMAACCPPLLKEACDKDRLEELELELPGAVDDANPRGILCHICGRRVLSRPSLPFHFSCCLRKFYAFEDEVPAADQHCPSSPPILASWHIGDMTGTLLANQEESDNPSEEQQEDLEEEKDEDEYSDDGDHEDDAADGGGGKIVVLMCYTCGTVRESPETILQHLIECRRRWRSRERLRPRAWRRGTPTRHYAQLPGPEAPLELLVVWNRSVAQQVKSAHVCENCNRSFAERDRLDVHKRGCVPEPKCQCGARFERGPKGESALRTHVKSCPLVQEEFHKQRAETGALPQHGVCCYLCGRRCLVTSLSLHIARCRARWISNVEASRDSARDARAREVGRHRVDREEDYNEAIVLPDPPSHPIPGVDSSVEEREAYSTEAFSIWRANCPKCAFCSRAFDTRDKLRKHQSGGCPNIAWELIIRLVVPPSKLLETLCNDDNLADLLDQSLRAEIATMFPSLNDERVRVEKIRADDDRTIHVAGGVYGFRTTRDARAAYAAWDKPDDDCVVLQSLPEEYFYKSVRIAQISVRSGVASIPHCSEDSRAGLTFVAALLARRPSRHHKNSGAYEDAVPFSGRVRSNSRARCRRAAADEHEKRNRRLNERLQHAKAVVSTRGTVASRPHHCHAAVRRKREARETKRNNEKLRRALSEIYKEPSRLEKHGVQAINCTERFAHRTALYADDTTQRSQPMRRQAWTLEEDRHQPPESFVIHDVPKGLGVAQCAACGIVAYYGSDGTPMRPCPVCRQSYYCDHICCAVDAPAHALQCSYARGQRKWPIRLAKYWVDSRSTLVARKALRKRPKPSVEAVMREIATARAVEAQGSRDKTDRSTEMTKHRISCPRKATDESDDDTRWRLDADDARDDAVARLSAARAKEAEAKRERNDRHVRELLEDHRATSVAAQGSLEGRLAALDERALELALERRDVMRQLEAAHARDVAIAAAPRRAGTARGQARQAKLAKETAEKPRAASSEIGAFHDTAIHASR